MKTKFLVGIILLTSVVAMAQPRTLVNKSTLNGWLNKENLSGSGATGDINYKLKGFNLGLGIGGSVALNKDLVIPTISPIDNTLHLDKASRSNFTLTTLFTVPLRRIKTIEENAADPDKKLLGAKVFQVGDTPSETNTTYVVPYGPYLVFNVNYSDFTKAAEVKPFNQSISGGMGFGWRFNDIALVALTLDATSFKQPKDFLLDMEGKTINDSEGNPITSLDPNSSVYFKDITTWSVSFKIVYLLSQTSD